MRIVRRDHQLVRPKIFCKYGDRSLDRFERNEALALENLAWTHRQASVVRAQIVKMPVHSIDIAGHPCATAFNERHAKPREFIANASQDEAGRCSHHLGCVDEAMFDRETVTL